MKKAVCTLKGDVTGTVYFDQKVITILGAFGLFTGYMNVLNSMHRKKIYILRRIINDFDISSYFIAI